MKQKLSDQEWDELVAILRNPESDEEEEEQAAERLRTLTDPARIPNLYAFLREKGNFWVRELAAEPLARLEGTRALPALLEAQHLGRQERHDNDGLNTILFDMFHVSPQGTAETVIQVLSDHDFPYRREAAWCLGFLPQDLALEPLRHALTDTTPEIREEAARALCSESFLTEEAIAALLQALSDPVSSVRVTAAYTLGWFSACETAPAALSARVRNLAGDRGEAAHRGIATRAYINQRKAQPHL
jgi:HEAT repeat protein